MLRKSLLISIIVCLSATLNAQIEVAKIIGKNTEKYRLGYGAFVKLLYPISDGDDLSLEIGAIVFFKKTVIIMDSFIAH